jgi:hypothetical protein
VIFWVQTNSITAISILDGGSGYVPGDLKIYDDTLSGFIASFSVHTQNGSVRFSLLSLFLPIPCYLTSNHVLWFGAS